LAIEVKMGIFKDRNIFYFTVPGLDEENRAIYIVNNLMVGVLKK